MPVEVDPSQVHSIQVDPSQVQASDGASPQPASPKSFGGFLSNVVSSAGSLIGDTANIVLHPLNTAAAIGSVPVGIYEKLGGPVPAAQPGEHDAAQTLDAMIDHFKQRYGSLDAVKESLYNDPVGVLADVSTVLGAGGAAADAAKFGKTAEVMSEAARSTNPLQMMARPAKAGVTAGLNAAGLDPEDLYRTALKPRVTTPAEDVRNMVATGLTNSIPVSEAGSQKLEGLVKDLQGKIDARTQAAAKAGITIDPEAVANRAAELDNRLGGPYSQVNPASDRNAIKRSVKEFLDEHTIPGQPATPPQPMTVFDANGKPVMSPGLPAQSAQVIPIPADKAQQMKAGTYAKIRDDYGAMSTAQIESQKALARGLKEELTAQVPELSEFNLKEGALLDLQPVLENAVNKAANRSGGFKDLVSAAAAGSLTGEPVLGTGYAVMQKVMEDPGVRSRLAILINRAQQRNPAKWGFPSMANAISRINAFAGEQ